MDILKIGFIGSGFIARFMAEAMKQVRNIELTAIYNRSGASDLAAYAQNNGLGKPAVYNSIREVCRNSDAVALFTPNHTRIEIMEEVARAARSSAEIKGVICEKPLGRTVKEARTMVELAESARLPTAYFENQVHMRAINNALEQLKPQIDTMGPLMLARSTEEHAGPHSSWFWDPTLQGGGVLSDMGCHSIAASRHILTPPGKPPSFLEPVRVQARTSLLKWGQPQYRKELKQKHGVDYADTPAEDFCTGVITFRNPETGQQVIAQFTDSWMYDKQGLRLTMEGLGPGYALDVDTLLSPGRIFIGDEAAAGVADAEKALEKSTSSRGLLGVQPNEADLYGYVSELRDMRDCFLQGNDALLDWQYGLEITRLCQAAYLSAESGGTIDLTDPETIDTLKGYTPLIALGKGGEVLYD